MAIRNELYCTLYVHPNWGNLDKLWWRWYTTKYSHIVTILTIFIIHFHRIHNKIIKLNFVFLWITLIFELYFWCKNCYFHSISRYQSKNKQIHWLFASVSFYTHKHTNVLIYSRSSIQLIKIYFNDSIYVYKCKQQFWLISISSIRNVHCAMCVYII